MANNNDELTKLKKMVDDMTMAAARSAIALLHSFGLSGQEAEDMVMGKKTDYGLDRPIDSGIVPQPELVVQAREQFIDPVLPDPTIERVIVTTNNEMYISFDRLVPFGHQIKRIDDAHFTAYDVMVGEHMEDHQAYRCYPAAIVYK